jgi:citrate/tricarballylate utilization protein
MPSTDTLMQQPLAGSRSGGPIHATPALAEADRLMTICNSCRYCEGLCAVFPAMEARRSFADGDLNYLANLCHGCGACYADCQFSPPHAFDVNVPRTLAVVRAQSYEAYVWPRALAPMFQRNGVAISIVAALSIAVFILGFAAYANARVLFGAQNGPGAFYRIMPHNTMVVLFGSVFLYALVAIAMAARNFWRDIGAPTGSMTHRASLWQAIRDAGSMRYLDGGGAGCTGDEDKPRDNRRNYHHLTFYGFVLCFASTSSATLYHYLLKIEAPYPWYDLPVVLGTLGGIGLVVGPIGLFAEKSNRDPALIVENQRGMETAFIAMLFLTGATGLALLILRATPAMGVLLALHLGVVFALFLTMPYGKFVHGIYRFLALVRYAHENREKH